eukprot:340444_1
MMRSVILLVICIFSRINIIHGIKMPAFSWDTLPVWIHMCNTSGVWNDTTLKYFAKYPIITFEKGQGVFATEEPYASKYAEDKIIDACRQIKAVKPDIICIFYYNSINDWTMYKIHETLAEHPEWWLRDNNNRVVLIGGDKSFPQPEQGMLVPDYRQPIIQKLWADECINITANNYGIVDGCFSDKPQYNTFKGYNFTAQQLNEFAIGHNNSISSTQVALNKSNASIMISNNGWVPPGIVATQLQVFKAEEQYIQQLLSFSTKGILVEAHAGGSECDNITNTLAAFLISANKYSYYACSKGWIWPGNWNVWYPQYDKPLGEPLGPAVKNNGVYSRSFKSGTKVTFNTKTNVGNIDWASNK